MARIESSILFPRSTEEIFSFLCIGENHRRFIPRMMALNQTSPGAFGQVGTTLSGMLNYFGVRIPVEYEILEVKPNQRLAMKGQMGPFVFKDGYILKKNGDSTEIKFWLDLNPTGWAGVFWPLMGLVGKIHAWETLRNLKRELAKKGIVSSSLRSSSQ